MSDGWVAVVVGAEDGAEHGERVPLSVDVHDVPAQLLVVRSAHLVHRQSIAGRLDGWRNLCEAVITPFRRWDGRILGTLRRGGAWVPLTDAR